MCCVQLVHILEEVQLSGEVKLVWKEAHNKSTMRSLYFSLPCFFLPTSWHTCTPHHVLNYQADTLSPWETLKAFFNRVSLITVFTVKFVFNTFPSVRVQTSRPLNLVVSHSPLNSNGSTLVTRQPLESTPERQKQAESLDQQSSQESANKDTGLCSHESI